LKMLKTMQIYQKCIFWGFHCFFAIFGFFCKFIKIWVKNWVATTCIKHDNPSITLQVYAYLIRKNFEKLLALMKVFLLELFFPLIKDHLTSPWDLSLQNCWGFLRPCVLSYLKEMTSWSIFFKRGCPLGNETTTCI